MAEVYKRADPCPFCGDPKPELKAQRGRYGWFVYVHCKICGSSGGSAKKQATDTRDNGFWYDRGTEEALYKWNLRRSTSVKTTEVQRAEQDH